MSRSKLRWRNTEEPNIRVEWRPEYVRRKRAIQNDDNRRALDLAEEAIIVDPHHRRRRALRPDGTIVDWNEPAMFVMFRVDVDVLLFVDFRDLWSS